MDKLDRPSGWKELIKDLNESYGLELAERFSMQEGETFLAEKLNGMIQRDFNTLVRLLYRIDVDEAALRELLKTQAGRDAGRIMARLIIERQLQKIKARPAFKPPDTGSDEERW
jgi:hypothetical protein